MKMITYPLIAGLMIVIAQLLIQLHDLHDDNHKLYVENHKLYVGNHATDTFLTRCSVNINSENFKEFEGLCASGMLYYRDDESGTTFVIECRPADPKICDKGGELCIFCPEKTK
jgi:hypothetical protein